MIISPEDFARLRRDSKQESEVLAWLRQQDEVTKFEYVWRVLRTDTDVGLVLVNRAQLQPVFLEVILEHGFVYADASSIKFWLDATVNGIGHKRLLTLVRNHLTDAPLVVHKVLYWLPLLFESQPQLHQEIRSIRSEFEHKYPSFRSTRSTGIHATGA